ncbi:MAG: hypothetical protein AB1513_06880 [Pseudomonadota bacterium]
MALRKKSPPRRQAGIALVVIIALLGIASGILLVNVFSAAGLQNEKNRKDAEVLEKAKTALIGRAASDDNRPGSLPCPDTNNDGSAEIFAGNDCPNYIGRLPWRTLGLPDLRDSSGERLWYALSPAFRDNTSAQPINSNTKGTLLIYRADGTNLETAAGYNAVAVIFTPGNILAAQSRGTTAEQNNPANYLDTANGRNNATSSGPFIAGEKSATFNDRLLIITTKELMPVVEQRVAGEVRRVLTSYYTDSGCDCYPWADSVAEFADYDSNEGLNRGWLPNHALPVNWSGTFRPPSWFFNNEWYKLIYYSVAKNRTDDPGDCDSCIDNTLSINGVSGVSALFFMPGTPIDTLIRAPDKLSDHLEDTENNDGANDRYVTPTSQFLDKDRLYRLP